MSDPNADPYRQPADPYGQTVPASQPSAPASPPYPPVSTPPVSPTAPLPPGSDPASYYPPTGQPGYQQGYGQPGYPPPPPPGYGAPGPQGYAQPGFGIDPVSGLPLSDKSKVVAGVLQLVLGGFGVGRFYTGHTSMAIAQIAVTWLTCGLGAIWPLVDGILILVQQGQTDSEGRILRS